MKKGRLMCISISVLFVSSIAKSQRHESGKTLPYHSYASALIDSHSTHLLHFSCIKGSSDLGFAMGIYKEERVVEKKQEYSQETTKRSCMACLLSLLISMAGGLILGFWEYRYHQTNSQLWMVPFSLIMLVTPAMVSFAVFVSGFCNSKKSKNGDVSTASQTQTQTVVRWLGDSVHDPEK